MADGQFELPTIGVAYAEYLKSCPSPSSPADNYGKLATTGSSPDPAAATVGTPLRLSREPQSNIIHTIRCLERAAHAMDDRLEVWLWANDTLELPVDFGKPARSVGEYEEVAFEQANEQFDRLVNATEDVPYDRDALTLRYGFDFLRDGDYQGSHPMTSIRSNFMEAMLHDALLRDLPASQPVFWVDADTTFIGRQAFPRGLRALHGGALLVKMALVFTGEPGDARPPSQRTESERLAAIFAIARQIVERPLEGEASRPYPEECGVGLTLGTLALAGKLQPMGSLGESRLLQINLMRRVGVKAAEFLHLPRSASIGTSTRTLEQLIRNNTELALALEDDSYVPYTRYRFDLEEFLPGTVEPPLAGRTAGVAMGLLYDLHKRQQAAGGGIRHFPDLAALNRFSRVVARLGFPPGEG